MTVSLQIFQIRDHKLTVIATDGSPIEPIVVDSLVASPGERFDVVMDATTVPEISNTQFKIGFSSIFVCLGIAL